MSRAYFETNEIVSSFQDESLLRGIACPLPAINETARALFEIELNAMLHMPDENAEFAKMSAGHRQTICRNAAWLIGRLALSGFKITAMQRKERKAYNACHPVYTHKGAPTP